VVDAFDQVVGHFTISFQTRPGSTLRRSARGVTTGGVAALSQVARRFLTWISAPSAKRA
jgi:hypothetical protein